MGRLCVWHSSTLLYPPYYFYFFINSLIIR
nr:MAG TPA: hypothetical protein [Caudoviricetes sp.]